MMAKMKPVKRHGLALSRSLVTAVFLSLSKPLRYTGIPPPIGILNLRREYRFL